MKQPSLIAHELQTFIARYTEASGEFDQTTDLIASGVMDSLLITDLVVFIEGKWGVSLGVGDISPKKLRSVSTIADLVNKKLSKGEKAA